MYGQPQTRELLTEPRGNHAVAGMGASGHAVAVRQTAEAADGGLFEIWRALWRKKLAISGFAAAGALCGLLAAGVQPSVYQAKTLLEIEDLNDDFLDMQQVAAITSGSGPLARAELQTQIRILESRAVVGAAAERVASLADPPASEAQIENRWNPFAVLFRSAATSTGAALENAIQTAARTLQVRSFDGSRVFTIVCDSTDPHIAANFVNAVADEFIRRSLRWRSESARHTEEWLNYQLAEAQRKLESAENSLRAYVKQRGLFSTPEQQRLEQERLGEFQQALARAQEDRIATQSRHELAASRGPEAISELLDDGTLREYSAKLVDLRRQYAELSALYTDQHHRVKQVLAQIRTLEPILEQERAARLTRIHNEFEAAARRERLLADDYQRQKELLLRQADVAVEYNLLDREVQTARQIYETLLQRVKEAGIATAMAASPARVVDRATAPASPYKPNGLLSGGMGLLSGAFLGIVLAFLLDQSDHRLRQPGEAARHLGVPELGVVHQTASLAGAGLYRSSTLVLRIAWRRDSPSPGATPRKAKPAVRPQTELGAWQRKHSRWAECFRATRTSILFHGCDRGGLRSLVVSSPSPGEGKTTIACNLAIALAETGRRTLLVDADLRKPRLHEVFGLSGGRGLSDLLHVVEPSARLPLGAFLCETAVPRLRLLPSGNASGEGPALLHCERTVDLFRRLEREFDFVVIDTPPLLPVSDGRVVARFADAAVLVLRLQETTREEAQLAAAQLQADGSRLLGVVLNAWKPNSGSHPYYSGSYDYAPVQADTSNRTLAANA